MQYFVANARAAPPDVVAPSGSQLYPDGGPWSSRKREGTRVMDIFETGESEVRSYCRNSGPVFDRAARSTLCRENDLECSNLNPGGGALNSGHNNPEALRPLPSSRSLSRPAVTSTSLANPRPALGPSHQAERLEELVESARSAFGLVPAGENATTRRSTEVLPALRNRRGGSPPSSSQSAGSSLTAAFLFHEQVEASLFGGQRRPA